MHKLISASKKKKEEEKSADGERMIEHSPKILSSEENATTCTLRCCVAKGVAILAAIMGDRVEAAAGVAWLLLLF